VSRDHHLVLIGLMGAGKTSVGERCARRLGRGFVDTDALIVANAGASIAEIFAREGEPGFRTRERAAVADAVASPEPLVIACGGGAMVDAENRRLARANGVVIWLQAAPGTLAARVEHDGVESRPLVADGPTTMTLTRLAEARQDAYAAAAHATVLTEDRDLDAVTDAVLAEFDRVDG
jgi:shikimate kinase